MKNLSLILIAVALTISACKKDNNSVDNKLGGVLDRAKVYMVESTIYSNIDTIETYYNYGQRYSQTVGGSITIDTTVPIYQDSMMIVFYDSTVTTYYRAGCPNPSGDSYDEGNFHTEGNSIYMDYKNRCIKYLSVQFTTTDDLSLVSADTKFKIKLRPR